MNKIDPRLIEIVSRQTYPLLFVTISGAHLYGFPSPDSDYDLRGIHILPLAEVIGLKTGQETIEISEIYAGLEIDLVTHDIKKFFGLLLRNNGYVLEQLYSPLVVHQTTEYEALKEIAKGCITCYHSHHYLGFAKSQWRLFEKENPPRIKPLLYIYRVLLTGIYLMQTGEVEANLVTLNEKFQLSYLKDLIDAKLMGAEKAVLQSVDLTFHQQEYDRLCQTLEEASQKSHLPKEASAKTDLHELLVGLRLKY